jgi:hypothetical protein
MEAFKNNSEQIGRRQFIVDNLRARGYEDPEVKETIAAWYACQEEIRTSESGSEIRDMIEQAELFRDAGDTEQAYNILWDAQTNVLADASGDSELAAKIQAMMDALP